MMIGLIQGMVPAEVTELKNQFTNLGISAGMATDASEALVSLATQYEQSARSELTRNWCALVVNSDDPVGTYNALMVLLP